jgi:sugar-specific transcriptional regulator TrmB
MTNKEFLQNLGLNSKQIDIYLYLASSPESSVVEIAKSIKRPRSSIYLELDRLISKGFVTSQKIGKTTKYKIIEPNSLKYKIKEEKEKLTSLTKNIDEFVKNIDHLKTPQASYNSIQVYKDQEGIKQLLWNMLSCKSGLVVGYSPGTLEDVTDRKFSEKWRAEFKRRNLHNKIILNASVSLNWSNVPEFLDKYVEARTLEDKKIKFDREMLMYDNTLVVISKKTDPDQYGIEIEDKLLVQSLFQLFDFIWNEVAKVVK